MSAHSLNEINVAVEFLKERGCQREGGEWRHETVALGSDPVSAARRLRQWLISKGPPGARCEDGAPVWTR